MTPTMKLRVVVREIDTFDWRGWPINKEILQQWWEHPVSEVMPYVPAGEWRDIPVEKE